MANKNSIGKIIKKTQPQWDKVAKEEIRKEAEKKQQKKK